MNHRSIPFSAIGEELDPKRTATVSIRVIDAVLGQKVDVRQIDLRCSDGDTLITSVANQIRLLVEMAGLDEVSVFAETLYFHNASIDSYRCTTSAADNTADIELHLSTPRGWAKEISDWLNTRLIDIPVAKEER